MVESQSIPFLGGYVEIFISEKPVLKCDDIWKVRVLAKIISSGYKEMSEGKKILNEKGFTTNGHKENEFYKYVEIKI